MTMRVILSGDLCCCLLPQCEALRTCRSGFPIAAVDVSYCVNGFHADSCHNQAPFGLVVGVALFMVPVVIFFFQKFLNFCSQICGSGLISVRYRLTMFLPNVVQPTAQLSKISVMLQAMDE